MDYSQNKLTQGEMRHLYKQMLKPRMIEEKMLSLLRQGKISKWFSGIGQEAIAVAASAILDEDEWVFPMHRNLGVFTSRGVPLYRLFAQWQGKPAGYTKGRDRSFHFGSKEEHIWGMISHLGPQLSLAAGVALAHKLRKEEKLSIAFTGEGATSEGEFHEALNVAAVWELPVIFIVENNGYGLSTPSAEQFRCASIADKGIGYGMEAHSLDGNNIVELYQQLRSIAARIRKQPAPVLVECRTFRMRGHEEASGTKYVPQELMDLWAERDPISNFEEHLLENAIIDASYIEDLRGEIKKEIKEHLQKADKLDDVKPQKDIELQDVYKEYEQKTIDTDGFPEEELRFVDAIHQGLDEVMAAWPDTILMGQDIAEYGGVFKITEGFVERYGKGRVRNTPLCESAILGIALGLSMKSFKSMVEMQFADFVSCGFNQIVNNIAKIHYRWGHNADMVIRMPTGAGVGAGPFHSQSNEAWFTHVPGIKVVYPSNARDAKGLLIAAFEDPNPVMFFEHKALYRSHTGMVPQGYYNTAIGKAALARAGHQLSIISYGMGVHWAMEQIDKMGIEADVLDLRTLVPLDYESIRQSVMKTNRVLILHEDTKFGGLGGEIAAYISESLFEHLDAPVMRIASLDTAVPFAKELENVFLPQDRLERAINDLVNY